MFITFEGGDGSGKTTQMQMLAEWLCGRGFDVVTTRDPGGTELGRHIRKLLLHGGDVSPRAEALLYAADRAHNVATVVRPALERGAVVLADRYIDSSAAYQGAGRTLGEDEVRGLSLWGTEGLMPDLTVFLDLPAEALASRLGGSFDRIEAAGARFHEDVRRAYLRFAAAEPERWFTVDATAPREQIAEKIRARVAQALGGDGRLDGGGEP